MKILSVGFVLGALLTLTLAASVQAWEVEADTNDNEDTASKLVQNIIAMAIIFCTY